MSLMFAHDAVAPRAPAKLFAWEECARAMLIGCWFLQDAMLVSIYIETSSSREGPYVSSISISSSSSSSRSACS